MTAAPQISTGLTRAERTEQALFRGGSLTLANPRYKEVARTFLDLLSFTDSSPRDLTVVALRLPGSHATAEIIAREAGVAAGLEELAFLLRASQTTAFLLVKDGEPFKAGTMLARVEGEESKLLAAERVGLNLLQRMCGIATAAHQLQARVAARNPESRVVGTRKTPLGLLDKRALHLGGVGTHRIGLSDAILIKNNHLAVIAPDEEEAAPTAIERAWSSRHQSAFIEVEVRSASAAEAAARKFHELREQSDRNYPCLLMLDNLPPDEIAEIIHSLREKQLHGDVLIEASGGITEVNIADFAAAGVDAISVGALTHSPRALDIAQRIS
jgi:nicotinate-nucleotide pyrophosphorylase (carboxylating)